MKTSLRLLVVLFVFSSGGVVRAADNFVSMVLNANQVLSITVPENRFLKIRTFTQEAGGLSRGRVSVMANGSTNAFAFVASIADPNSAHILDPVNDFVVAGPATVTVTCGDTTSCFITYRKDANN
jgi:hypothetical protein